MKDTAKKPILVIMAAGMGSRFGGLKQIEAVGPAGEAILDYSLFDAHRAGFETVVFIIKHAIEDAFKSTVGARAEKAGLNVRYAYQELDILPEGFTVPEGRIKPWGTAHAILSAADAIDAPFAVINADDYYGRTCFELIYNYLSAGHTGPKYPWVMVGYLLGNTVSTNGSVSRGVCVTDADGAYSIEVFQGNKDYKLTASEKGFADLESDIHVGTTNVIYDVEMDFTAIENARVVGKGTISEGLANEKILALIGEWNADDLARLATALGSSNIVAGIYMETITVPDNVSATIFDNINSNCLIYVTEDAVVPNTWKNVVKGNMEHIIPKNS